MLTQIPSGLAEIIATFGDYTAPDWETTHLVSVDLPYPLIYDGMRVNRTRCHKLIVENVIGAFQAIESAGLTAHMTNYGGLYNQRMKRGMPGHPSTHCWGIAIDMEPARFPLGSTDRQPQAVVDIMARFGWVYGGDFAGRKDGMHWQTARNY